MRQTTQLQQIQTQRQEYKVFIAVWGDFDSRAMNCYQDTVKKFAMHCFTPDAGYEPEDIQAIDKLEIGQCYDVKYGNHFVRRIE